MARNGKTAEYVRTAMAAAVFDGLPQGLVEGQHYSSLKLVRLHVSQNRALHKGFVFRVKDMHGSCMITALKEHGLAADVAILLKQIEQAALAKNEQAMDRLYQQLKTQVLSSKPSARPKFDIDHETDDLV